MGRPPLDLSLYLVTDTAICGQLGVAATVSAAVSAGVTVVQLRDVDATDDELVALGRDLVSVLRGTGVPLIVNDRVRLVEAIGADGAHVGQSDIEIVQARALLGPTAYLGLSVQTMEHVEVARSEVARSHGAETLDYLGVGPVWETATKPDAEPPGGLGLLGRIISASPWPCVAIGGIDAERLAVIRRTTGAAGVAVVSAICGQPDVAAATRALRNLWDGNLRNGNLRNGGSP